ncbi:MAG: GIY-YIG nuclease family protein [Devosia sp.]|nr:GIY-YIG nuclease family protein [Devosia sp.]
MRACVYILRCADGSYYVGNTRRSLDIRLREHNDGTFPGYTSARRPVDLVYSEHADTLIAAFQRERQLKGRSRRKKEALINGQVHLLPDFASRPPRIGPSASRPNRRGPSS